MIQILGVFFDWSEISFGIINGIYSVVIRIYNIMLGLVNQENMDMSQFENIATTMYVLAGVFILFKVVIAMVQMILNPDLVTDKQAGAGKLITRIVTCLIMLIAFSPNGFLFGYEGLFSRIEKAVLADDGLINNIINADLSDQSSSSSGSTHDGSSGNFASSSSSSFLIENVYAANPTTCYYYRINEATPNAVPGNTRYELTIKEIYKIYFYYDPKNTSGLKKAQGNDKVYYKFSEARIGGENGPKYENGKSVYYNKLGYRIKVGSSVAKTIKNSNCPKKMTWDTNVWEAKKYDLNATELGLHGGTKTLKDLKNAIWNLEKTKAWKIGGDNPFVKSVTTTDDTMKNTNRQYLSGVEPESITFGQAVASSVQECASGMEKQCADAQQKMFATKEGNDDIIKLAGDKDLDLGFIVSTVAGIGLIIYLLFLCVEVIIRRFKLFFLEVLAPIPIISYVDPKDKTFNTWFKMYISTYLDLFIKLIAISIALALVKTVAQDFWNTGNVATGIIGGALVKFFYIVAILVFAKILPSMISKIFNLDSMGGSFKDIMGMAKGAAGFGAGAVLGAGAGLVTGFAAAAKAPGVKNKLLAGAGAIGSGMSGALRGAGAGSKGNIFGSAKSVASANANRRNQYNSGLKPTDLLAAATVGKVGMDYASRTDRKIQGQKDKLNNLQKFTPFKGDIENAAEDSKFMKTLRAAKANKEHDLSEAQMQDLRGAWIESQISGDSSILNNALKNQFSKTEEYDTGTINPNTGKTIKETRTVQTWDYDDEIIEGGKQAAIKSTMKRANDLLADNTDVAQAAGTTSVSSFSDLDGANKKVKQTATSIDDEIFKATTANTKYGVSQAAKGSTGDSKK